ncbi:hypothetical protein [Rossellomorea aquimaris]|uniref:Uncharacterized protein n=1 Tax=Rossellomorea aquimaris TaxID=189382 RepID=A0A5D4TIV8_9BACI|nr:hypothetical protein [Rossellomorea aquimaris]TYS75750.1 hypothetical protein FZC80_16230 [Rossellomorea aquimaris]
MIIEKAAKLLLAGTITVSAAAFTAAPQVEETKSNISEIKYSTELLHDEAYTKLTFANMIIEEKNTKLDEYEDIIDQNNELLDVKNQEIEELQQQIEGLESQLRNNEKTEAMQEVTEVQASPASEQPSESTSTYNTDSSASEMKENEVAADVEAANGEMNEDADGKSEEDKKDGESEG